MSLTSTKRDGAEPELLFDRSSSNRRARRALIAGGLFIAASLVTTFAGFEWRSETLLHRQLLGQARAFTQEIVATRRFVSAHGGVFVPETSETTLNPFLARVPGLRTRITDEDGNRYILQNPAVVTQSIGALLASDPESGVDFRLTSDRPVNPKNLASGFDAEALDSFAKGAVEHSATRRIDDTEYFMYARALRVEPACLQCHGGQGYRTGQVRGAISVRIRTSELEGSVRSSRLLVLTSLLGALTTLLIVLFFISRHFLRGLLDAESRLRDMATLDSLTGVENRRMGVRRLADEIDRADRNAQPLAVLMLDLDHFKAVNDEWGHATGDEVLIAAAAAMKAEARSYDTVARMGGEEFLVLLPGMRSEAATAAAERIRTGIAVGTGEVLAGKRPGATASVGVAMYRPGSNESAERLLGRADKALYDAKDAGRDAWRMSAG